MEAANTRSSHLICVGKPRASANQKLQFDLVPEVLTANYADNLKPDLELEKKREDSKQKITKKTKILFSPKLENPSLPSFPSVRKDITWGAAGPLNLEMLQQF